MGGQGSRSVILVLLGTVAVVLLSCRVAAATTYQVGDSTWALPASNDAFYDDWSANQQFFVGDFIEFKYDNTSHNVYSLNTSAAFDICNLTQATMEDTSGDMKIPLKTAGTKWYVCQIPGHCTAGMKVKVVVLPAGSAPISDPAAAQGPANPVAAQGPANSSAPSLATAIGYGTAAAMVISAAIFFV